MLITFNSPIIQNAIYTIACENEKFKTDNVQDESDDKDMMKYFWEEVRSQGEVGYGLEEAISDYLLMKGEFEIYKGKYGFIADDAECEVYDIKHWGE